MLRRYDRPISIAVLILGALAVIVPFYPGLYVLDSVLEMVQARTGDLTDFHAPLLQWLWHLVWGAGFNGGSVFILQVCIAVAGIYSIIRLVLGRLAAAVGAFIVVLSPLTYGQLALVGRDAWFLCGLLILFGATARALRTRTTYWPWVAVAIAGAWIALAARQNAAFAVLVGLWALALLVVARREFPEAPLRPLAVSFGAALVALVALIGFQTANKAIVGVDKVHPEVPLYLFDLGGMSLHDHENHFPASVLSPAQYDQLDRYYDPYEVLEMATVPGAPFTGKVFDPSYQKRNAAALRRAWIHTATGHPGAYVSVRGRIFLRQLNLTGKSRFAYYRVNWNNQYPAKFTRANDAARSYMAHFHDKSENGNLLFTVWIYLLLALVAMIGLLRRRSFPSWIAASVLAAAIAHQAGIFFGLQGVAYRFEFPAVTLIVTIGVACVGVAIEQLAARRRIAPESGT